MLVFFFLVLVLSKSGWYDSELSDFWKENVKEDAEKFLTFLLDGADYASPLNCNDENPLNITECLSRLRTRGEFLLVIGNQVRLEELWDYLIEKNDWFGHYLRIKGSLSVADRLIEISMSKALEDSSKFLSSIFDQRTITETDRILILRLLAQYWSIIDRIRDPTHPDLSQSTKYSKILSKMEEIRPAQFSWFDYYSLMRTGWNENRKNEIYEKMKRLFPAQTLCLDCYNRLLDMDSPECQSEHPTYFGNYQLATRLVATEKHLGACERYGKMFTRLTEESKCEKNIIFRDSPYHFNMFNILKELDVQLPRVGAKEEQLWVEKWILELFPEKAVNSWKYFHKYRKNLVKKRGQTRKNYEILDRLELGLGLRMKEYLDDEFSVLCADILIAKVQAVREGKYVGCEAELKMMARKLLFLTPSHALSEVREQFNAIIEKCTQNDEEFDEL